MMKLHKTDKATVAKKGTSDLTYVAGFLDKTETLSLVHQGNRWNVSIQHNGIRLANYAMKSQARRYMIAMLDAVQAELAALPLDQNEANTEANKSAKIKEIHFEAVHAALNK